MEKLEVGAILYGARGFFDSLTIYFTFQNVQKVCTSKSMFNQNASEGDL